MSIYLGVDPKLTTARLRLYPGLPYMERTATKDDVIPLHRAVKLANGTMSKDLVVRAGQVCHKSAFYDLQGY